MSALAQRLYAVDKMVKPESRLGELPSTKEAYGNLMRLALPSVMEMVLMSLIGSVDTMMIGGVGTAAIAAVGLTGQPRMLMLSIILALNIGVTAIVARRKGEGRRADANLTMRNALVLLLGIAVVMALLSQVIANPLLRFAGAMDDTIDMASIYFRIQMMALPLNAITMCINAAQRGVGNTRITMAVNMAANIFNVIFNYLLIGGNLGFPAWGVMGAAIATNIGYVVGFLMALRSVTSKRAQESFLYLDFKADWRLRKETISGIAKVGGNSMFEQLVLRFGFFLYAKIVAELGTEVMAAHNICMQFSSITFTFGDGIGVAGTSLVGQMLGQKRPDLSLMYGKMSQRVAMTVSAILMAIIVTLRYPLVSLFTEDAFVINLAAQVMLAVALMQPFQTSSVVMAGCLRGAGDTRFVALTMLLCVAGIRPALSYLLVYPVGLGLIGAWSTSIIDQCVRMILVYRRFHSGKWFNIKV